MENTNQNNYSNLNDEELNSEYLKLKKENTFNAFAIGMIAGIAGYSIYNNGFGFLLVILLFGIIFFHKKSDNFRAIQKEIKNRKL